MATLPNDDGFGSVEWASTQGDTDKQAPTDSVVQNGFQINTRIGFVRQLFNYFFLTTGNHIKFLRDLFDERLRSSTSTNSETLINTDTRDTIIAWLRDGSETYGSDTTFVTSKVFEEVLETLVVNGDESLDAKIDTLRNETIHEAYLATLGAVSDMNTSLTAGIHKSTGYPSNAPNISPQDFGNGRHLIIVRIGTAFGTQTFIRSDGRIFQRRAIWDTEIANITSGTTINFASNSGSGDTGRTNSTPYVTDWVETFTGQTDLTQIIPTISPDVLKQVNNETGLGTAVNLNSTLASGVYYCSNVGSLNGTKGKLTVTVFSTSAFQKIETDTGDMYTRQAEWDTAVSSVDRSTTVNFGSTNSKSASNKTNSSPYVSDWIAPQVDIPLVVEVDCDTIQDVSYSDSFDGDNRKTGNNVDNAWVGKLTGTVRSIPYSNLKRATSDSTYIRVLKKPPTIATSDVRLGKMFTTTDSENNDFILIVYHGLGVCHSIDVEVRDKEQTIYSKTGGTLLDESSLRTYPNENNGIARFVTFTAVAGDYCAFVMRDSGGSLRWHDVRVYLNFHGCVGPAG